MAEGMESIGDAVTGSLLGRAVEPRTGEEGTGKLESECLNCGTELAGDYCHSCGQRGHVHRTLSAFWHDLLHGVLHFEGKIWRTLPLLAWRPGELTRRYIEGERARFVSPVALFLFSVFLMFAIFGALGSAGNFGGGQAGKNFQNGLAESIRETDEQVAELEKERAKEIAARQSTAATDKKLKEARNEASLLRLMKERGITEATLSRSSTDITGGSGWLNSALEKAKQNPSLLLYKVQTSAYKFSWALIPLSVPFLWLLFPFSRRFRLYDHTVFVTYSLCFMTLLVIAASLLRAAGVSGGFLFLPLLLIPPFHMYRQLRGTYRLRRFSALWRTFLLLIFAGIAATLFMLLLLALGVLG
jgi:hypothetical protein